MTERVQRRVAHVQQLVATTTIGGRLLRAFLVLAVMLSGAGALAYTALHSSAATATEALDVIRRDARLSSALSATVTEEIQAASRYLRDGDVASLRSFQRLMFETHRITRAM
jgi:hypothetical protein